MSAMRWRTAIPRPARRYECNVRDCEAATSQSLFADRFGIGLHITPVDP